MDIEEELKSEMADHFASGYTHFLLNQMMKDGASEEEIQEFMKSVPGILADFRKGFIEDESE